MRKFRQGDTNWAVQTFPLAALLMLSHIDLAGAGNVISRAIERAQPCSGLKTTVNKVVTLTIGIDQFKTAELETLKVDVAGDKATIALVGSLACRTSDEAVIKGDASAKFSANANLNLATCVAEPVSVRILSTGGTFGAAIDAFKGSIEKAVEKSIAEQAKALCQ